MPHLDGALTAASEAGQRLTEARAGTYTAYANTRPLERQTGVDLVYYNGFHGCFVLVQYKRFDAKGTDLAYWPDSNKNFASELTRMRKIDKACTIDNRPADIQLMQSATFFKFCDPVPFEPGTQELSATWVTICNVQKVVAFAVKIGWFAAGAGRPVHSHKDIQVTEGVGGRPVRC